MSFPVDPAASSAPEMDTSAAEEALDGQLPTPLQQWAIELRESYQTLMEHGEFTPSQAMQLLVAGIRAGWYEPEMDAVGDPDDNGEDE